MAELRHVDGRAVIDYTARDYDGFLDAMRALVPAKLPEWTGYDSESDFGRVLLELFAHVADQLSYYVDRAANESFLATAQTRRSVLHHLRLVGYRLGTAAPASATLSLSVPAAVTQAVTVRRGDAFATRSSKERSSVRFEYARETDLTIDFGAIPPDATGRRVFAGLPVEEGRLVSSELLGVSDGTRDQRFHLGHAPLVLRSAGLDQVGARDLIVRTELGAVVIPWTLRESLAFSREGQNDFEVDVDEDDRATVVFGDGAFGAVPPAGARVFATYRVGGGAAGNVGAGAIRTIVEAEALVALGARAVNPTPATGGADRETIEHAVKLAPLVFRSQKRAVTAGDYEALARAFPGVGKVRARTLSWNRVALYVAPDGGGAVSDVLEGSLLAYFEDKRPLSTLVEIRDVDYVPVYVTVSVGVDSYHAREAVAAEARRVAGALLAFANVSFGATLYLSKVYEAIEDVDGVAFVTVTEFRRPEDAPGTVKQDGRLEFGADELPKAPDDPVADAAYAGGVQVRAEGGF